MSRWISAFAVAAALELLAPVSGVADPVVVESVQASAVEVGAEYYQLYCVNCHGDDAKGSGEYAGLLTVKPPDLTKIAARRGGKFPREEIVLIIQGLGDVRAHGPKVMPRWDTTFGPEKEGAKKKVGGKAVLLTEYLMSIQED